MLLNLHQNTYKNHSMIHTIQSISLGLIIVFSFSFISTAQTDTLSVEPLVIKDSLKTFYNRKGKLVQKTDDEVFFGMSNVWGNRTLKERANLFGDSLGIRENEIPLWTRSFELGYRSSVNRWMMVEFGVEFNQIGVQYVSTEEDDFLRYQRVKRSIALPMRAVFQWGDRFLIQGALGFAPKMFLSSQYTEIIKNQFDMEEETVVKLKDNYNYFNIDVIANLGIRWNLGRNLGVYFLPEFRYGLLDTYQKQTPHVQHLYGVYLRWGLQWLI
jgi:hypothetical protein